ncbi:unnamed protein product [Brassicogethes aeneus]|uniref:Timeless N-terminal domain-containing protein n=1 Tax=Brassicogethes aeneus TaxID=1431903 RepID=A0A9P0FFE1_BRAAE|nr:unnamed protein product [Brassicogethes aeneus]
MLTKAYSESAISKTRVYKWYKSFQDGREDVEDDERPERTSTLTTDINMEKRGRPILDLIYVGQFGVLEHTKNKRHLSLYTVHLSQEHHVIAAIVQGDFKDNFVLQDSGERGDENSLIIERILILIRNILYVPADPMAEKRTDNDASVHDQVLWALHQSGMLDIMLYMTSSSAEQAYYMHLLEILSFMLREQKASELASAALQRSQNEKMRDEAELLSIRNRENNQKRLKVKAYTGTRHSRFGGTYVVKTMKGIGDNDLVYHKPLSKALNFDVDKKKPKTPKNRLPMQGCLNERRSAFSVRLFLKEFCVEFLNGAYNTMMYHAKDNLSRSKAQAHDESYYLWAIRFFMEFNRCYKFEVKLVSETMSVQAFHYVQQQSENYFDLITTDKKKFRLWSRRLHLALLAYRELFATLLLMDKSTDKAVRDSSRVLKSNIFYVLEYREFVLTLLVNYDELKMSDVYLKDLIETQHIFLKMLEAFCKQGTVMFQKKGRAKKKKKQKALEVEVFQNNGIDLSINKWVVVSYDKNFFPGVVCSLNSQDYKIKALKNIGENKYIWPLPEDKIWYCKTDILFNISPPIKVTKRPLPLDVKDWNLLTSISND